jgi:DNA polymerase (family 10)
MSNDDIADLLKLYSQLLDLHDKDSFRAKSYAAASFRIDKLGIDLLPLSISEIEAIDGLGKSLAGKIDEIKTKGSFADLDKLTAITPLGVMEMLRIKGIGPKKVGQIWRELHIESVGELLYACNENRLAELKGFGQKTQETIIQSIEFMAAQTGKFHYARVEATAGKLLEELRVFEFIDRVELTGEIRRKCEIIEKVEILIASKQINAFEIHYTKKFDPAYFHIENNKFKTIIDQWLPLEIEVCVIEEFEQKWFETTSHPDHLKLTGYSPTLISGSPSEQDIYQSLNIPFIIPELREGINEVENARQGKYNNLIELSDLKGVLHNHSTWSDGMHSLEEMATYCKEIGYEYLGICDHSRTAVYAKGLEIERVQQQHLEIDKLNAKLFPFKIYKGIESDILGDGSLDYPTEVLSTFDFVVASVHQNLKMTEEKANARLLAAIENKYTTILGHPTGRLLLSRAGYPINHQLIIDACAAHGVAIELNAHPYRLDIDWRWLEYAMSKSVPISINPDAHRKEGFHDMYYGICVARKGGLTVSSTLNSLSNEDIGKYFSGKKA